MIKNYFKSAWRSLVRNKAFSVINIMGLALSLTCALLIMLWVQDERNVDGFHANNRQLYEVYERQYSNGKISADYRTQGLMADELKRTIPEIKFASGLEWMPTSVLAAGNKIIKMDGRFAGADFFKMFSYPLLEGTPQTALSKPGGIAISRKMAQLFFGSPEKAIGKAIRYEDKENLAVVAVFENLPANSSEQFDFLRAWEDFENENSWAKTWGSTDPSTYIQLQSNADPELVKAKIKDFIYRYNTKEQGSYIELGLQLYRDKYLHSSFVNGLPDGGRIGYVRLFSLVAVFILFIACINFMNLATARSTKRAKEVGIRKVVGAVRAKLMGQFVAEAMLLTLVSIILAFILMILLLPVFNNLTGKQLLLPLKEPVFWGALFGLLIVTGFVAGSYPALFLSSLNPVRVLKGNLKIGRGAIFFRKGLVVFQFALSVILMVGTILIKQQMNYVETRNLGYDRENLIYIPIEGELIKKYPLFKQEAGELKSILNISEMRNSLTAFDHSTGDIRWLGKDPDLSTPFADMRVGYDFVKTLNLKLKEGRDFSKDFGSDSASYMLNEMAVQKIGYKDPIGKPLWWGDHQGKIIGVLKDFHFNSMHQPIEPLIVRLSETQNWGTILVRIAAGKTKPALAGLEKVCKELNPDFPFTYEFSDQAYSKLYTAEQLVNKLSSIFAFLAIFISCLGLFGLAAFTAEQRTKEIGIRRVLGANVMGIVSMLSVDFLKLLTIAIVIGWPLAYYFSHQWLQDFAYRVDISWWIFILAGFAAVLTALITVSFHAIKAAIADPVKTLRTE